ncbi:MAG: class I SAM-dependent methyltransferase [Syntrophotaleaceae bacterium]
MNRESYLLYADEISSWLHAGRRKLISRVLSWHLPAGPASEREILEVGAGAGQNVDVLRNFGTVDVMEINPAGLERLRAAEGIRTVFDSGIPEDLPGRWDVICACDVIEHIEDDAAAVRWIFDRLKPGGLFFATVPAFPWLMSDHDRALGHFRRYDAATFDLLLPRHAIRLSGSYFNSYLFPLGVLSRAIWQFSNHWRNASAHQKQRIPTGALTEPLFRSILLRDVQALTPSSRRKWGMSYYLCAVNGCAAPDANRIWNSFPC